MLFQRARLVTETMRLLVAAVLFVTAVATARMQGEMGALALAFGGKAGILCSGTQHAAPGLPDGTAADDGFPCGLCVMMAAACAPAPATVAVAAEWQPARYDAAGEAVAGPALHSYAARGPPAFG